MFGNCCLVVWGTAYKEQAQPEELPAQPGEVPGWPPELPVQPADLPAQKLILLQMSWAGQIL